MDFKQLIEEIYDSGGGSYPAYSEPPRKDFGPLSQSKGGYDNPYQQNSSVGNLAEIPPPSPISYPWPLQTVTTDLADGFVLIVSAADKMSNCIKNNPSITDQQKEKLLTFFKSTKQALDILKDVGLNFHKLNLAEPQPPMNPIPFSKQNKPNVPPSNETSYRIKLP